MLISVIGTDAAGQFLLNQWQRLNLPTAGIIQKAQASTPMVSVIFTQCKAHLEAVVNGSTQCSSSCFNAISNESMFSHNICPNTFRDTAHNPIALCQQLQVAKTRPMLLQQRMLQHQSQMLPPWSNTCSLLTSSHCTTICSGLRLFCLMLTYPQKPCRCIVNLSTGVASAPPVSSDLEACPALLNSALSGSQQKIPIYC